MRAAVTLGAADGVGALSLQAIARAAGVSKALLLYHFRGKSALLAAVVARLGAQHEQRLRQAAAATDAMEAWRALARDETGRAELALLGALALESELDAEALRAIRSGREAAAATLASAILASVHLAPRVAPALLGRLLLRQLDGLSSATAHEGIASAAIEAELDAFALALLALGH